MCSAPATDEDKTRVQGALRLDDDVIEVHLETSAQAHARFAERFAHEPELVDSVEPDDFPAAASLRVTLADDVDPTDIVTRYDGFDGVGAVSVIPLEDSR